MSKIKRLTESDWKNLEPRMRTLSHQTTSIGYAIFVEGKRQVDVARENELSTQAVFATIKDYKKSSMNTWTRKVRNLCMLRAGYHRVGRSGSKMIAEHGKPSAK
ncbi:TrfB-related DNA-binding protein [Enterobacter cloacae]|uniref:TrfB-related DNA-binding protein n=1 Tax=Enterobacter cloacae TaxID=550 RepID=UPI00388EAF40